jgi:hypothetical protein
MEDFKDIELKNNLTLEPRLQEYLKKKSFYKKNNIDPSFDLEREFNITKDDRMRMKGFLRGSKDLYCNDTKYTAPEENMGFSIKHDDFKNDPRYERLQKKLQRDKDANMAKYSYGSGAEINGHSNQRNTNFITDDDYQREQESNFFLDSKPYMSDYYLNVRKNSRRTYDNDNFPPSLQYKKYSPWETPNYKPEHELPHNNNLNDIIKKIDEYKIQTNTIRDYPVEMDKEVNYSNKPFPHNSYASVPLRGNNVNRIGGTRDVNVENCLIKGLPDRDAKFKSLGYPNYSEHSFDYISGDIQDPKHVVLPFPRGGFNSRLENDFKRAKSYQREIF